MTSESNMHRLASTELGKTIKRLSMRPQGTNSVEIKKLLGEDAAPMLHAWFKRGRLFRSKESSGTLAITFQYFANPHDLEAWEAIPPLQRPNVARKRNNHSGSMPRRAKLHAPNNGIQLGTWARAPLEGKPVTPKNVKRTQGPAYTHDTRYELSPQERSSHRGVFSVLGPGRYLESEVDFNPTERIG